ncbi:unnamed protein product [Rotaria magnacalcarata]|uniref:Homeobox domain-containing protein n=3 Tax=Rotaria magnacalcarata TaxID=392030 RepID=A0A816FNJ6_9BILA|nr:unnamed protein product [Rotaria magnacalcarata]
MDVSPLQLDTNCFNNTSHYHPSYYGNNMSSTWSSSSSLLCPSTTMPYQTSTLPSALQPIENYCSIDTYYPSSSEPIASSSEMSFYSSSSQFSSAPILPPPHLYSSDDFIIQSSSSSTMMLPQNRANYTRHQLVMLNEIFKKHKYPNSLQKTLIAKYIGVSRDQIRIWFQNKRRKVQLINKGQAKQTKSDVECEYGEYRRHLPKNFLGDLFQELYKARGAPARLPVKRDSNSKIDNTEHEQQNLYYYPTTMNSNYYYEPNHLIEQDESSHEENHGQYLPNYAHHVYSDRL